MSDGLTIQGKIADLPVPEVLRSLLKSDGVSSVTLSREGLYYRLYAKNNMIVFSVTNDPDFRLSTLLFMKGELDLSAIHTCKEEWEGEEQEGSLLCRLGFLAPDDLLQIVEQQVREIVRFIAPWRNGEYEIIFDDVFPESGVMVKLESHEIIHEAMAPISLWSLIRKGLGGVKKSYGKVPNMDAKFYHLSLSEDEAHVYGLLETPKAVEEMCRMSYLSNFATLKILWMLKCLDLVEEALPSGAKRTTLEMEEYRWSSMVESYNNAFAQLFNIVYQEEGEGVYDFIDEIFVSIDDSTQKALSGCNPHNEGRLDFDQLYNNLIAEKPDNLSQSLQDVLNEVLYAWILSIRQHYDQRFNDQLDALINAIHEE